MKTIFTALVLFALAIPACGGTKPSGIRYASQPNGCGVARPYALPTDFAPKKSKKKKKPKQRKAQAEAPAAGEGGEE